MGLLDSATRAVGGVIPDIDVLKLVTVVDLVWEHRDELVDLLTTLPRALADAGDAMSAAGTSSQQAGSLLRGEVRTIALDAAATLEACRAPLEEVTLVVDQIGNLLERLPLVGNVAEPFTRGLRAIGEVSDNIDVVLAQVRELGERLADVGAGLDTMGGSLQVGGGALTAMSGRPVVEAVTAAAGGSTREAGSSEAPTDRPAGGTTTPKPTKTTKAAKTTKATKAAKAAKAPRPTTAVARPSSARAARGPTSREA